MPNWTTNKIICKKNIGEKLLTKVDDSFVLDFNKLIPMPESMHLTAGSIENDAVACYYISLNKEERRNIENQLENNKDDFYKNYFDKYKKQIYEYLEHPERLKKVEEEFDGKIEESNKTYNSLSELGKQYVENIINYRYSQWYDWSINNWGTKWNVLDDVYTYYDYNAEEYIIEFNTAWSAPFGIIEEYSKLCSDDEFHWEYINEDYDGHHYLRKENGTIIEDILMLEEKEDEFDI